MAHLPTIWKNSGKSNGRLSRRACGNYIFPYVFFYSLFTRDQYLSSKLDFCFQKTLILHSLDFSCETEKANMHTVTSVSTMDAYKVVQVCQSGSEGELKDVNLDKSPIPNSGATI